MSLFPKKVEYPFNKYTYSTKYHLYKYQGLNLAKGYSFNPMFCVCKSLKQLQHCNIWPYWVTVMSTGQNIFTSWLFDPGPHNSREISPCIKYTLKLL